MTQDQADFTKLGFCYAAILLVLSNVLVVDWQNDTIFYLVGIYPCGAGLFFWPIIGYASVGRKTRLGGAVSLGAVAAYDYGVVDNLLSRGSESLLFIERVWAGNKLGLVVLTTFFVMGQVVIVSAIIQRGFVKAPAV